jgi:hypothetical protein
MIRALTENIWWKLLSLAIAFALWVRYSEQTELGTSLPVAIQYRNMPPNLDITNSVGVDRIYMKVRGPSGTLTPANLAPAAVLLDMKEVDRPGERTFVLSEKNVQLPAGVHLLWVVPSQVHLTFETHVVKEVPVKAMFLSSLPAGYHLASQEVIPERVRIAGPQTRVNAIAFIPSDPIDLSSTYGDAEFRISPRLVDNFVHLESPSLVVVRVKLEKLPG